MSRQKKKSPIITIVVMLIFAVVVLGGFYYIANSTESKEEEVQVPKTEVEKILAKDLETSYPGTPKEVIKLYSRISKAFYDGNYDEKQFEKLVDQYYLLLDDELIEKNKSKEAYTKRVQKEIDSYSKNKKSITSYIIQDNSATKYSKIDGKSCASIGVAYMLKTDGSYSKVYERFLLRQDDDKKWKIVGWGATTKDDVTVE